MLSPCLLPLSCTNHLIKNNWLKIKIYLCFIFLIGQRLLKGFWRFKVFHNLQSWSNFKVQNFVLVAFPTLYEPQHFENIQSIPLSLAHDGWRPFELCHPQLNLTMLLNCWYSFLLSSSFFLNLLWLSHSGWKFHSSCVSSLRYLPVSSGFWNSGQRSIKS